MTCVCFFTLYIHKKGASQHNTFHLLPRFYPYFPAGTFDGHNATATKNNNANISTCNQNVGLVGLCRGDDNRYTSHLYRLWLDNSMVGYGWLVHAGDEILPTDIGTTNTPLHGSLRTNH